MGMGNVCGEVEAQSLGLASARVNFAICYLETFEQALRTYPIDCTKTCGYLEL